MFEKERTLSIHCRKNGWTDISGELEEYEKVLEEEKKAESGSFFALQYNTNNILNIIYKVTFKSTVSRCCTMPHKNKLK